MKKAASHHQDEASSVHYTESNPRRMFTVVMAWDTSTSLHGVMDVLLVMWQLYRCTGDDGMSGVVGVGPRAFVRGTGSVLWGVGAVEEFGS